MTFMKKEFYEFYKKHIFIHLHIYWEQFQGGGGKYVQTSGKDTLNVKY